jgi:hypothetical protein
VKGRDKEGEGIVKGRDKEGEGIVKGRDKEGKGERWGRACIERFGTNRLEVLSIGAEGAR